MRGDALLQALVNTPVADNKARLETLFLDFVAEATLGQNRYPNSPEVLTSESRIELFDWDFSAVLATWMMWTG